MESDPGVFTELIKGFGEGEAVAAAVPAWVQDRPARRVRGALPGFPA